MSAQGLVAPPFWDFGWARGQLCDGAAEGSSSFPLRELPDSSAGRPQPRPTPLPAGAAFQLKLHCLAWPELQPHLHCSAAWPWALLTWARAPAHRMPSGEAWR